MTNPTLSVIMPNYNHGHFLDEAIRDIAMQSRPPDEFLILDDASQDNSVEVIESWQNRLPYLRLIRHEQNQGVNVASRRLFTEAKGDYIFAAAADDIRLPGFFAGAMGLVTQHPQAGLVFGDVHGIGQQKSSTVTATATQWQEPLYADPDRFLKEYLLSEPPSQSTCCGTIYRRDALLEVGGYRQELKSWADTFAFQAIGLKYGVCYLPSPVAHNRILEGSYSQLSSPPRRTLDIVARAKTLMLSEEFRDQFPPQYVRQWTRAYRWQVVRDYYLGSSDTSRPRPSFLWRNLRRLHRIPNTLALWMYRGS